MQNQKIKIITDSACDLPAMLEVEEDIRILNFPITVDGKSYEERVDFTPDEFYKILKQSEQIPTTSQYTALRFGEVFEEYYKEGYTDLIYVSINAKASATHDNALMARDAFYEEHPEAKENCRIYVIDSGTYTIAYGYPVYEAARKAANKVSAEEIVAYLEGYFRTSRIYFAPYTLEYVKKSGRVSCVAAFVGELMGLKPIITFEKGESKTVSKVRGEKAIIPAISKLVKQNIIPHTEYLLIRGENGAHAEALKKDLEKALGYPPVMTIPAGGAISINAGPDVVGVVIKDKTLLG